LCAGNTRWFAGYIKVSPHTHVSWCAYGREKNIQFDPDDTHADEIPYEPLESIDFSRLTMGLKFLSFFEDDTFLGMQAMNVGIVDAVITEQEYVLLQRLFDEERTPAELAYTVSALSQMWVFGLCEVFRMWRDRRYEFNKLAANGGIDAKLDALRLEEDELNATVEVRRRQLEQFRDDAQYRARIEADWSKLEPVYRMVELFRMNLAKHAAPGRGNVVPRAPGYCRINQWCGSMDYELIGKD
jgi:hypothetical protein